MSMTSKTMIACSTLVGSLVNGFDLSCMDDGKRKNTHTHLKTQHKRQNSE